MKKKLGENELEQVKGGRVYPKIEIDILSNTGGSTAIGSGTGGGGGAGKVKFDRLSIKK